MKSETMLNTTRQSMRPLLFISAILLVFGCTPVNRTVPMDRRIQLAATGLHHGVWKHSGLTVNYAYRVNRASAGTSGAMDFESRIDYGFGGTDSLDVWIDFIDREGKVLSRRLLYSSGYRTRSWGETRDLPINKKLELPPDTAGLSFSYTAIPRSSHR